MATFDVTKDGTNRLLGLLNDPINAEYLTPTLLDAMLNAILPNARTKTDEFLRIDMAKQHAEEERIEYEKKIASQRAKDVRAVQSSSAGTPAGSSSSSSSSAGALAGSSAGSSAGLGARKGSSSSSSSSSSAGSSAGVANIAKVFRYFESVSAQSKKRTADM
jgi:hypothetical protein